MMIDYMKVQTVLRSPLVSILSMTLTYFIGEWKYLVADCSAEVTTYAHPEYDLDLFDAAGLLSAKVCMSKEFYMHYILLIILCCRKEGGLPMD